jgi:hypothetical protein
MQKLSSRHKIRPVFADQFWALPYRSPPGGEEPLTTLGSSLSSSFIRVHLPEKAFCFYDALSWPPHMDAELHYDA